ncbi:putative initiation factor eIF-4 gamma, MA3 [Rosa chinensis]|uniref:Putative initiation factor eIF-4 gamma, MA3 n=1 Tax=Rosa chinensis TaxID=74649 RepID=A0A2P6QLY6_ROSCH|nr:pre-mRNA-splicing factor CWC22 homolog [Rosa chinensis]PRQ35188.1 putative initiation factor eIF-4 gamma, MA3 [Rosa chinensis]
MARRHSGESSDDDVRGGRDKYRQHRSKSESRSNNHLEQGEIDSSDSDRDNRTKRQGKRDDEKERERSSERVPSDRHGRWRGDRQDRDRHTSDEDGEVAEKDRDGQERERKNENGNRQRERDPSDRYGRWRGDRQDRDVQTSDEDGELAEKDRGGQERERKNENGNRQRENGNGDRGRENRSSEDDERLKRYRHESGHRRREDEDGRRNRDRHSRHYSERRDEREERRTSERKRDSRDDGGQSRHRNRDDDGEIKNRRNKEVNERREDTERDDRMLENSKPQGRSTLQQGNLNNNVANLGKSGGVYIPPYKLARMMKEVEDKSSVEYQRLTWDALRKSINGLVNKVNAANIKNIIPEIFAENLIRGRGLFCRSCMKSQMASPGFTDIFAGLVAVVNTKFPEVGELLLRRIVLQLKRAFKRNDKPQLLAAVKFIAHLVNQQVAHEIIALELLTVLLENPTDDSVEVAVGFVTECGSILQDLSPKGLHGIFERFRGILHEGEIDKRVQFLIEGLFALRKAKFQGHPAVRPELDLVEQEDQLTHEISLQEEINPEITLDIFKPDPDFIENEKRYEDVKKTILGEDSEEEGSDAASDGEDDDDEEEDEDDDEEEDEQEMKIRDETETNLVNLRRTIYLTIMSSVDFEEAGHKLLKIKLEPGQEMELCVMLLECCSQERTYLRYYGLLGQRFCMINRIHQENFEKCFVQQYSMIHRLETNKLRNVAKFFAHLLGTDALPWHCLAYIRLTEEDTTSSSRIFIKILFQELSEHLGIRLLNERLTDPAMQDSYESIFPRDNPKNTRFAINFFTSIGLGGITENLREYLKHMPRLIMQQQKAASDEESDSSGSSDSDSGSASSESESESSSSESESDRDERRKKKRRRRN